jgi:hypothetical protein
MIAKAAHGGIAPDTVSFNTVLSSAIPFTATTEEEKERTLQIVKDTFAQMTESQKVSTDELTYEKYLQALGLLMEAGEARTSLIADVFGACCSEGLVGKHVMKEVLSLLSSSEANQLLGDYATTYNAKQHEESLPAQWTKNLKRYHLAS